MATGGSGGRRTNTGERIFCSGDSIRRALIYGGHCGERGDEEGCLLELLRAIFLTQMRILSYIR
jgi:hypothetical protein